MTTHYETLGIPSTATADAIRKAYKTLAQMWHPDRAIEQRREEYREKFTAIGAAYAVLKDPAKRAAYDGRVTAPGLMSQAQVDAASATATAGGPCPVCGDSGSVRTPDLSEAGRILFWSNKPCPRGCKPRAK